MKLPWKSGDGQTDAEAATATQAETADTTSDRPRGQTAGKGRPTRSRREAEGRRRGPVAPAPKTRAEARARRKELRNSMTKEEKKAASDKRRSDAAQRRELMMQGDERYLAVRDQGRERALVRDLVDSRRHISTLFIPVAVVIMVFMFATASNAEISALSMPLLIVFMLIMAVEGYFLGRRVNKAVAQKYPNFDGGGFRLGWYAFMRTTQLRKMRVPRPRVSPGDVV